MSKDKLKILLLHTIPEQEKEWLKLLESDERILNVESPDTNITELFQSWQENQSTFPDLVLMDVSAKTPDGTNYQVTFLSNWCKENHISLNIFALNGQDEKISSFQQRWAKYQGLTVFPKLSPNNLPDIVTKLNEVLGINITPVMERKSTIIPTVENEKITAKEINNNISVNTTTNINEETSKDSLIEDVWVINLKTDLQSLNEAIINNPSSANLFCERGNVYSSLGNDQQALNDYEKAIKLDSKSEQGLLGRGSILVKRGDYLNGIKNLTQVLKLNQKNAFAYHYRGLALFRQGDERGAKKDYDQAIKFKPDFSKAYNDRGFLQYFLGKIEQALQDYTQAIKHQPDYADAYYNRGNIYSDLGKFEDAIADYTEAIRCNPNFSLAYGNRGIAYYELDLVIEAINDTTKSANLFYEQGDTQSYQQAIDTLKQMQ